MDKLIHRVEKDVKKGEKKKEEIYIFAGLEFVVIICLVMIFIFFDRSKKC